MTTNPTLRPGKAKHRGSLMDGGVIPPDVEELRDRMHLHVVEMDSRGVRELKFIRSDGSVGTTTNAAVLAAHLVKFEIDAVERQTVDLERAADAWRQVFERRSVGLADTCRICGDGLSMKYDALRRRNLKPSPEFTCNPCQMRLTASAISPERRRQWGLSSASSLTAEERVRRAKHANASMSPQQRVASGKRLAQTQTLEERAEALRKGRAAVDPEKRLAALREAHASMTDEERSRNARKAKASMSPQQRSDAVRKSWAIRRAKASKAAS